jgi:hypothetical protein
MPNVEFPAFSEVSALSSNGKVSKELFELNQSAELRKSFARDATENTRVFSEDILELRFRAARCLI